MSIREDQLESATKIVLDSVNTRFPMIPTGSQPLVGSVLEVLAFQILIPIMVSVCATNLSELLKERRLKRLKAEEARKILDSFIGMKVSKHMILKDDCFKQILDILRSEGFTESDVQDLYQNVKGVFEGQIDS